MLRGALRMATAERRNAGAMDELPLTRAAGTYLGGRAPWYTDWVTRSDLCEPFWEPMSLGAPSTGWTSPSSSSAAGRTCSSNRPSISTPVSANEA